MNYHKYYIDRKTCLEKLLRVNEEFLSHVDEWESIMTGLPKGKASLKSSII